MPRLALQEKAQAAFCGNATRSWRACLRWEQWRCSNERLRQGSDFSLGLEETMLVRREAA